VAQRIMMVLTCDDVSNDPMTREPVACGATLLRENTANYGVGQWAATFGWAVGFGQAKCPLHWRP
jgi:hypothetical protein